MITKTKMKQLEEKCNLIKRSKQGWTMRDLDQNHRPMGKDGYLLSKKEIELQKKEDEEIDNNGGMVIHLVHCYEGKIRPV